MNDGMKKQAERTFLVGLVCSGTHRYVIDEHIDELERLVETAGGVAVDRFLQDRPAPDPATLVGSGMLERIAERCQDEEVQTLVFDEDLTGSQVRNIERVVPEDVKVLDRAGVILDIFAQRARTAEAKTQVELAQLSYLLPRLTRRWRHLSRQAGGIGTRGVGETQLEIDRRLIAKRISQLRSKLVVIERDRRLRRERRRHSTPSIALVGYTNAGKSCLFRRLTHEEVLVEDRLFATLDPRARRATLGDGAVVVVTDTVGFIRKLPHHLVAPFRSTLEEATDASLVLHVVDAADARWQEHLRVGETVLEGLGVMPESSVLVLNKVDLVPSIEVPRGKLGRPNVAVSAITGEGLEELCAEVRRHLLQGPDVSILRVPLHLSEAVARAIALPYLLARRFGSEWVDVAVRADRRRLDEAGLGSFRVDHWEPAAS